MRGRTPRSEGREVSFVDLGISSRYHLRYTLGVFVWALSLRPADVGDSGYSISTWANKLVVMMAGKDMSHNEIGTQFRPPFWN